LYPFSVGVFQELLQLVLRKIGLRPAETIVDFDEVKGGADGCSNLEEVNG